MLFKSFIVGAFAALAVAQSSTLGFTRVPSPINVGEPQAITYMTSEASKPVTILLRKGASTDLKTIATLTTTATGGQYIWTPAENLESASDYALEIQQDGQTNYFGPFQIQGGTGTASSSSASASSSASSSRSSSSTASTTAPANGTSSTASGASSTGTGTSMTRNATMSSATLTTSASTTGTRPASTSGGSNTGAAFQGTSSPSAPAQTGGASGVMNSGSAIALVLGAVGAVVMV